MEVQARIVIREELVLLDLDFQVVYIIKAVEGLNMLYNLIVN